MKKPYSRVNRYIPPVPPRDGTRKLKVYEVYIKKGTEAAKKYALKIGLSPYTFPRWEQDWKIQH